MVGSPSKMCPGTKPDPTTFSIGGARTADDAMTDPGGQKGPSGDSSSLRPREAAVKKLTHTSPTLRLVPPTRHQLTSPPHPTTHHHLNHTHHHRHPIPRVHAPVLPPRAERLRCRSRAACSASAPRIWRPALCQSGPALTWSGRRLHVSAHTSSSSLYRAPARSMTAGPGEPHARKSVARRPLGAGDAGAACPVSLTLAPYPPPSAVETRGISLLPR